LETQYSTNSLLTAEEFGTIIDKAPWHEIDKGIRSAVEILIFHGFITIESCQGGKGHPYADPMVRFEGNEFDLIIAYETCLAYNLNVLEARRVYSKCTDIIKRGNWKKPIGQTYESPTNEIIFCIAESTGTIFSPD